MALQAAVGRGNNPFIGGSKTPNAPPPAMRGSIAPANTGVSSPEAGVAPGQPMFARNNRGSNIGIPYTRLVPLGNARFGLEGQPHTQGSNPSIYDAAYGSGTDGVKKNVITETEDLRATRIGFIHGRRRRGDTAMEAFERGQDVNGIYDGRNNQQFMLAPGMPGTERFQKLCSIEYLQRYFKHAFRPGRVAIKLGELVLPAGFDPATGEADLPVAASAQKSWWKSGLLRMVLRHTDTHRPDPAGLLSQLRQLPVEVDGNNAVVTVRDLGDGMHAGAIGDLGKAFGLPSSPMLMDGAAESKTLYQGIFAMDTGPFLRGKGITQRSVSCTKYAGAPQKVLTGTPEDRYVQNFQISRCLGDEVAFEMLERALEDLGITDWRPDGIVLSKGANDPSDKLSDEAFDVRDGQLYNMRIQGPALSTTWTGDPALEVMPMDKVFVVIVADVWFEGLPSSLVLQGGMRNTTVGADFTAAVKRVEDAIKAQETALRNAIADIETAKAEIAQAELDKTSGDPAKNGTIADGKKAAAEANLTTAEGQKTAAEDAIADAYKIPKQTDGVTEVFAADAVFKAAQRRIAAFEAAINNMQAAKRAANQAAPNIDFDKATNDQIKDLADELVNNLPDRYFALRDAELQNDAVTKQSLEFFLKKSEYLFKDRTLSKDTVLTNFRVRTATSSQMINYSPLRFNSAGEQDVDMGGTPDEFRKVYHSSRMGLALTDDMGEYIIGGWCIGNVLDTSASRAVMPGAGSNIGVRTAPNSMAHNINVQIEWWDADRMWRSFCNVQSQNLAPTLTPRHQKCWEEPGVGRPTNGADVLFDKDRPPEAHDLGNGRPSLAVKVP